MVPRKLYPSIHRFTKPKLQSGLTSSLMVLAIATSIGAVAMAGVSSSKIPTTIAHPIPSPPLIIPPPVTDSPSWRHPQKVRSLPLQAANSWEFLLTLSPDGKTLIGGDRTSWSIWDVETGEQRRTVPSFDTLNTQERLSAIALSPDGSRLAAGLYDYMNGKLWIKVWDVATGELIHTLEQGLEPYDPPGEPVTYDTTAGLVFSPDSQRLATIAGGNEQIAIWDLGTAQRLQTLRGGHGRAIAFSHDGQLLARSNGAGLQSPGENRILIWNVANPSTPKTLNIGKDIGNFIFSPDNRSLYVSYRDEMSADISVRRWELTPATPSRILHSYIWSTTTTFSPDGTKLIAMSPHNPIAIADLQSGQKLGAIEEYSWGVPHALSQNAQTFAMINTANQEIQVWRAGLPSSATR